MPLPDACRFFIDGQWVAPGGDARAEIVDPATRSPVGQVALATTADVDAAVEAAARAFPAWAATGVTERLALLRRARDLLIARNADIAAAITAEMGAPRSLSLQDQAPCGEQHFGETIRALEHYAFETRVGSTRVRREPIGVCALVTPWNWPINQVAIKVAPALASGCTIVLKPSELAPLDAVILAEILAEAGLPAGVFNLIHGDGATAGAALTSHPRVDMVSFTGSTRAGIAIGEAAARTVKRVALELGGKSAAIILDDADIEAAVTAMTRDCMVNSGQSCNAPTRILVPEAAYERARAAAKAAAEGLTIGMPADDRDLGPIANEAQYRRVVALIETALREGGELVAGGAATPAGLDAGLFVAPTVIGRVTPTMTIAREEVFGPVQAILTYQSEEEAIAIANDSPYGLSGYVWSGDAERAARVGNRLRTGMVHLNGAQLDLAAPFGGYKMSGNGREWGVYGLEEFLEIKSVYGSPA